MESLPNMLNPQRMEAFLGQRFSNASRQAFAAELDQGLATFRHSTKQRRWIKHPVHLKTTLSAALASTLQAWMGDLMRIAEAAGFYLSDLEPETTVYDANTYPKHHHPLPADLKLPASSYHLVDGMHHYVIHLVLPSPITGMDACLTSLRAWLHRLYGNIYLQDQVYIQAHYQQDGLASDSLQQRVGLEEKILLLAGLPTPPKSLYPALQSVAKQTGVAFSPQRVELLRTLSAQWQQTVLQQLSNQTLPTQTQQTIETAFGEVSQPWQQNTTQALVKTCEDLARFDQQLYIVPANRFAEFCTLRTQNPFYALSAAQARLHALLSMIQSVMEDVEWLLKSTHIPTSQTATTDSPPTKDQLSMLQQRLEGHLAALIQGQLARPYLLAEGSLPQEVQKQVEQFPLEVFRLVKLAKEAYPNTPCTYEGLQKRMTRTVYQRIYAAQSSLVRSIRLLQRGDVAEWLASPHHQALQNALAYFKARHKPLSSLCTKVNVVLQLAEQHHAKQKSRSIGLNTLAQGWAGFISHVLVMSLFCLEKKRISPARYWKSTRALWQKQMAAQHPAAYTSWLFYRIYQLAAEQQSATALASVRILLHQAPDSLRFALHQCSHLAQSTPDLVQATTRLNRLAKTVYYNHLRSQKHAIQPPIPAKNEAEDAPPHIRSFVKKG